ncbi:MAG: FHA domain-containing protein [Planctomycetota bacterium]
MRCVIDAPQLNVASQIQSEAKPKQAPRQRDEALEDTIATEQSPQRTIILEYQHESMPLAMHRQSGSHLVVGRSKLCPLAIECDQALSRQHFVIEFHDAKAVVRDLDSRNGTTLNGIAVEESRLSSGDQITAGNTRFTVWIS